MPSSTFAPPAYLPPARPNRRVSPPPKSKLGRQLWLWKMWFTTTFGLTVMETWEQVLFLTVFGVLFTFFFVGFFWYLPQHFLVMEKRTVYYLWGHEGAERHWWKWLGLKAAEKVSAAFKEV